VASKRRASLREAFGDDPPERTGHPTSDPVNTARETGVGGRPPITQTGEVEMVPAGRSGEMVPADKPVNMTFTVTAKERYLWTLELRRRGRSAVSVLRERMNELMEDG
jgi:hypothetical protein